MKLQIVEYSTLNVLEGNIQYRYMLELDEKTVLWTPPTTTKKEPKKVYSMLMSELLNEYTDYNMEHYVKLNRWPGLERKVIVEEEVSDHYLKDLKIQRRIEDLEKDFV